MVASNKPELHHAASRCLLALYEKADGTSLDGEGIQAWLEWEMEAMRWRVPIEIFRSELEALVDRSTRTSSKAMQTISKSEDRV